MVNMSDELFFRHVTQRQIPIRQYQGYAPLFFPRVSMMAAVFAARMDQVASLLPTRKHRPLRVAPGRALVALHCFEYQSCQLGPYNEVVLSIAMQYGSWPVPSPIRLAQSFLTNAFHAFVFQLPVDSEVAMYGGIDYYNVPKYMTRIQFEQEGGVRRCMVRDRDTDELIFELSGPVIRCRTYSQDVSAASALRTLSLNTYPVIDGRPHRALGELNVIRMGQRLSPCGVALRLGSHARAEQLRGLDLRVITPYQYAPACQLILHEPEAI